jgi:O-antigen biosynthesis protein
MKELVSIVIPNWFHGISGRICTDGDEALWFAKHCFERIKKFTHCNYELILIDNGSLHGQDLLKKYADVLITNKENIGFARACNQGFEKAKGNFIVCMNNDIFIWDNWLETMVRDYKSNSNIGVLMPALVKECRRGDDALKIKSPNLQQNHGVIAPGAEFGSCFLLSRKVMDEVKAINDGKFYDENFKYGFGEDRWAWQQIRQLGYETFRTHNVRIFHQGNVSVNTLPNRRSYTHPNRIYLHKLITANKAGKKLTPQEKKQLREDAQKEYEEETKAM